MAVPPTDQDIILALGKDLPVGLWVARAPNGELVYANKAFAEIMGMDARGDVQVGGYAEPYGIVTRDGERYPEHRMPFVRAMQEKQLVVVDDLAIHRADGTRVDVRAFARPVGDPITHVIIAFFDITREVASEKARAESERRLQYAQRLEAIGTLAGGIAHDFNNLLFGIKLVAAELALAERDPDKREALQLIDDITERSAALTRSLLAYARRGRHRAVALGLNDVVSGMSEILRRTLGGITFEVDLAAAERGAVIADQTQVEQVIMNLVVNARDALRGNGRVVVRTFDVTLDAMPLDAVGMVAPGPHVVLEIADDGPGISTAIRERVFEPYFTTKTKSTENGTGLGLATVLGIAERHGGACELAPGLDGRGTAVRVYLPVASRAAIPIERTIVHERARGTGMILVVDDDEVVRRAISRSLGGLGYKTAEACSGNEAVEIFRAHRSELRAVVLDMVMPGMNGRATYLAMREIDPEVDVILMSGYTLNEEVKEILDLGVRTFVSKPYTVETLSQALAQLTAPDGVRTHA